MKSKNKYNDGTHKKYKSDKKNENVSITGATPGQVVSASSESTPWNQRTTYTAGYAITKDITKNNKDKKKNNNKKKK